MRLPEALERAIAQELAPFSSAELRQAAAQLSLRYREDASRPAKRGERRPAALSGDLARAAYLAVRMPATYAAVGAALAWSREACGLASEEEGSKHGSAEIRSMLDLGSGAGTALWAAAEQCSGLTSAAAIEREPALIEQARRLSATTEAKLPQTEWLCRDLAAGLPEGAWDLVLCSYALNELGERDRVRLVHQAWSRTAKMLILVEPGTRAGFSNVVAARRALLHSADASDAVLVAPCPHSLACPMDAAGDWCHFAARVERSALHRRLKEAELGHEDEKFSYLAFARRSAAVKAHPPQARLVRHPRIFGGHAQLALCREGRIDLVTVTRSQKDDWRRLKRAGWGDGW